ncbi:UDP-3-O-(3-hydroxymyristoyl)glucosamine N-acyltransferase [Campylobacter sp. 19-13652]|uniref:UDP-3-O-(3-hydroxymyristoyl)glucosamine N-acyltransferase n=1 Tax=Campylobacter sp. 19-13652 TaxID=2840180 RepID=UPI001C861655|nr:UDP-3-O-(3-hydroxymyristoyl)glucosamine N-acyltransferase [Campylobacter sp. 19-13652]
MKLSEIAELLGIKFNGSDIWIDSINSLKNATKSELSYCDGEKNEELLRQTNAGAILVSEALALSVPEGCVKLIVPSPHLAFAVLSQKYAKPLFAEPALPCDIAKSAKIMPNVHLGSNVSIGEGSVVMAGAYIGDNVKIGNDCLIHPNVVIYNDCVIGDGCHLLANCVIGSDGFGYAHTPDGKHVKIYHNGNVVLEDFVEVGACTTIDRGVFESTIIKAYTKIDNLVQIGHNCELGQGCIIVSQVGLAGSSVLGRNVVMGGQSGSGGHLKIGDFAQIAARAGVSKSLEGGRKYAGLPAVPFEEYYKLQAKILRFFKKLK